MHALPTGPGNKSQQSAHTGFMRHCADRVLNYDSVKRPASQEMSGAEYGSPCVRYRDTWKGNTQAVRGANLPFLPIKMTRAVFTSLKLSKFSITSKSHRNIKYSK